MRPQCTVSDPLHHHELVSRLTTVNDDLCLGAESGSDTIRQQEGMSSNLTSDDSSFHNNSAFQGGAFFLSNLRSVYFNCASRQIDAFQLAQGPAEELCPSGDWSDNNSTSGYGLELAASPARMNVAVSASSLHTYISNNTPVLPINVSILDQVGRPILTGDDFSVTR